jgi:hypothetical protein
LPCFCLGDAILAVFFVDERAKCQARNHVIPARTKGFPRRIEWPIFCDMRDAGRPACAGRRRRVRVNQCGAVC